MGYALFFARKLSLNTRINNMNAELMAISNQQTELTNRKAAQESQKNLATATANNTAAATYANTLEALGSNASSADLELAKTRYNQALQQNSIFSAKDDVEIQQITAEMNALDTRRETLETQLTAAQAELEKVEKAEESAIKSSAPGYVG
ncbi:hypothetical protein IJG14_07385 [bacterium]|nr:hypothetical protein [bacterium]